MQTNQLLLPWEESDWVIKITNWSKAALLSHNYQLSGELEQIRSAPWSVVYRVPTAQGSFFFKALCPALKNEPLITKQLALWQPDIVQSVLEIEPNKGWMLMPDGGTTLRQVLEENPTLNYWKKILPAYARFQQSMILHRQELLDLGVKDRRLSLLPALATKLVSGQNAMCIGQQDGLSLADYEMLVSAMPKLQRLCEKLAQYDIPETLQHDDFHDGNIFLNPDGFKFFDWAESFIAHPFFTLVVTLRSIAYRFKLYEQSPELSELETLYLKEWQNFAPLDRLREAFDLAMTLGRINRALTWHMVVSSLPEPHRSNEADAVPGWLQLFLEKINLYA